MSQSQITEVPPWGLNFVAEKAKEYAEESRGRWLAGCSDERAAEIFAASTHHLVNNPDRRELHREILLKSAAGMTGARLDKPVCFYVIGPMAAGKTSLVKLFKQRLEQEEKGLILPYEDKIVETLFRKYRAIQGWMMPSDFSLYKEMLPEFRGGDDFVLIRPEASGLDQATRAWAQSLGANIFMEHLGDAVPVKTLEELSQDYELVVVGVTKPPLDNLEDLGMRQKQLGESTKRDELARTIVKYSGSEGSGYPALAQYAHLAVLLDGNDGFNPIHVARDGQTVSCNPFAYSQFLQYAEAQPEFLFSSPYPHEIPKIVPVYN